MIVKSGLQFAQVMVLARLLAPEDFGLMAMVLAVMAFAQVFSDFGVSNAIIHHQEVSANALSSLYWLSVSVGAILMLALIAGSGVIGVYVFNRPDLQSALVPISVSILLSAVGQQLRVMAEKALKFAILAKVEVAAAIAGFATAVGWAAIAPNVSALIAGFVVNSAVQTLLLWMYAADGWRPTFRMRLDEIRHFLKFGGYMMANNLVNIFNLQVDILIAGRFFPAAALGMYSLPRSLSLSVAGAINPVLTRVGLPVMAKAQYDKPFLKAVYLKTLRMTASINFPIYLALAVFSEDMVVLVFGPQWIDSALFLTCLAVWGMFRSCGNPVGSLLFAVGKADLSFRWNLAMLLVVPPVLWIASQWGLLGLAMAQAALMALLMLPAWYFLVRPHCGAQGVEYAESMLAPLAAAAVAIALSFWAVSSLKIPAMRVTCAAAVAIPTYCVFSYIFNREWLSAMSRLICKK